MWVKRLLLIVILVLLTLSLAPALAQDSVTITLAIPGFFRDVFNDELVADFEAENPGIRLSIVNSNTFSVPTAASDINAHLDAVRDYVSTADVVLVSSAGNFLSPAATQAGYYLNLAPIVSLDTAIDSADFYPAVWQAFQWDQGVWALPVSEDTLLLTYDAAAFDDAGLSYPTPEWTVAEFDAAIRALTQRDANGGVSIPGFSLDDSYFGAVFFRGLVDSGLYNPNNIPNGPQFARADVEVLADTWFQLQSEGMIGQNNPDSPLKIGSAFDLVQITTEDTPDEAVLLPGNTGGLDVQGFAVSGGTLYPEQAYALASFLTTRADVAATIGQTAARQSLAGLSGDDTNTNFNLPEDVRALVLNGVINGTSPSELRFFDYMDTVFQRMLAENLDAFSALQLVEVDAIAAQQTALDRKETDIIAVATPVPETTLASGEVALNFGYGSFASPLPNQEQWDNLIADFTANDPQVGAINFDVGFGAFQFNTAVDQYDCFYLPYNAVPGGDVTLLLSLDPFVSADPTFDRNGFVGNTLTQVQRDGRIYAMPITVEPDIMRYDAAQFNQVAAPLPFAGWTVDEFINAVQLIKLNPEDPAPFVGSSTGGNDLLILIAAFGGLPIDSRGDLIVYDFTNPANVDAIRQVLDLAKDGYLRYDRRLGDILNAFNFGNAEQPASALYADTLSVLNFAALSGSDDSEQTDTYLPTTYPRGAQYSAGSYTIGTAYISANSQNPEACYQWISTFANAPDLFTAMPARRALINDPATIAAQGEDLVTLYNEVDRILQDPNTIILPSLFDAASAPQGFLAQLWLFQAFDTYVLDDGDLEAGLRDAQNYAITFQDCISTVPPLDNSSDEAQQAFIDGFADCARQVDPRLAPILDLISS